MTALILDASVVVAWLANEDDAVAATGLIDPTLEAIAPDLLWIEAANALWRKQIRGDLTSEAVLTGLEVLARLPIERVPSGPLIRAAAHLAMAIAHPVYDCVYLALAMRTGAPLATMDRRLRQAAQRLPAGVRPVRVWSGLA